MAIHPDMAVRAAVGARILTVCLRAARPIRGAYHDASVEDPPLSAVTQRSLSTVKAVALALALGQTQASAAWDDPNAAGWYARAFGSIPTVTPAEWHLVDAYRAHPSGPPSAQLREILGRFNRSMDFVRRGSQHAYSDLGLDYSQGFSLELPHLGNSRYLAKVMCVDALVKMQDGHTADAADRVSSLYRMAGHIGQDRIVISSLVGQAVWSAGDKTLQTMLDRGLVGPEEAMAVLAAADTLETGDPFSYVDATMMEYELVAESVEGQIDADGMFSFDELEAILPVEPKETPPMSREEVEVDMGRFADYMDDVVEVFVEADPERGPEALAAIEAKLIAGEYGEIAGRLAPTLPVDVRVAEHVYVSIRLAVRKENA